jgi:hypothetical protein
MRYEHQNRFQEKIEEYRLLKQEQIVHFQRKETINAYGWTSIGAIITIAVLNHSNKQLFIFFCILVIPIMCGIILIHWLSNNSRIVKIGAYLYTLEQQNISERYYYKWETYLQNNRHYGFEKSEYIASICLYLGISIVSIFLGCALICYDYNRFSVYEFRCAYSGISMFLNPYSFKLICIISSIVIFFFTFVIVLIKSLRIIRINKTKVNKVI